MVKIGFELFWAHGPEAVRRITPHGPVFMDSKLHDIPTTVERASANIARLGVAMFNVHALGGDAMMRAALEGAKRGADAAGVAMPLVIAVTVLSSHERRRPRVARVAGVGGEVGGPRRCRRVGRGRARCAGGVRRGVLSRGAGHPARRHERARSGARPHAERRDRARCGLSRRRSSRSPASADPVGAARGSIGARERAFVR